MDLCIQLFSTIGFDGAHEGKYVVALLILAGLWALEHFLIQASLFDSPPATLHPFGYQAARLLTNLSVALFLVLAANWAWLLFILSLDFALSLVVLAYRKYFRRPLSFFYGVRNFREGIKVSSVALRIIPLKVMIAMSLVLAVKITLILFLSGRQSDEGIPAGFLTLGVPLGVFFGIILVLQKTSFRFTSARRSSIARTIYVTGYINSWIAEWLMAPVSEEIARELKALQSATPDRLVNLEPPWAVDGNVVILQLESFGWEILNHSVKGQEVTPFINETAATSRLFKVKVYHDNGSADMDFAVLSGGLPSERLVSYSIPGIDFSRSLPRFMGEHGYHTVSLHGGTGNFFNRRANFERMGWDEILFSEEIGSLSQDDSYWGVRDAEIFKLSSKKICESTQPVFHFLMSLDTHIPYNLIAESEKAFFPGSRNLQENYFDSMAVLDRNLRDYVKSLPGGTLVLIYGDHTSEVEHEDFSPAREGNLEFVPCLIYSCPGPGISPFSPDRHPDLPDTIEIHDVVNFLRRQVAARSKNN